MRKLSLLAAAAGLGFISVPAHAIALCDPNRPVQHALDCAGYLAGNTANNSDEDIQRQKDAIAALDGDFVWDGNFSGPGGVEGTKDFFAIGDDGETLVFDAALFGLQIIGLHFGNAGEFDEKGGVSVFYLFDFGSGGVSSVDLNQGGWSNAVLYTPNNPGVPEPATWMMMLMGFGAVGYSMRKRRKTALLQVA